METETFADYILSETDWIKKMEIVYYLQKRTKIFFDNSVIFKTFLAKVFMDRVDLGLDENLVLTASLLCNCKKNISPQDIEKIKSYEKDGADYLRELGFSNRFCRTVSSIPDCNM